MRIPRWARAEGMAAAGGSSGLLIRAVVVAALPALGVMGCGGDKCQNPCPEVFDVAQWCFSNGGCSLDQGSSDCGATCKLPAGRTLTVPIDEFASELGSRRTLSISNSQLNPADPSEVSATLDGQDGTHVGLGGQLVEWSPFPASPSRLELRYNGATSGTPYFGLYFEDLECLQANPVLPTSCRF